MGKIVPATAVARLASCSSSAARNPSASREPEGGIGASASIPLIRAPRSLKYADKLVRSFAALTDALNRHRGKGQQLVRVEHVHVHPGGQAIVGTVTQGGGGGCQESEDRPHAQAILGHAPEPALRGANPERELVPVAGGEGQETVPDARRSRGQRRPGR